MTKIRPTGEFRSVCLKALGTWRQILKEIAYGSRQRFIEQIGLSAGGGLAAILYAQVSVSRLLEEPGLIEDANLTAEWITLEQIEKCSSFDVLSGAAGVILALLKLYAVTNDSKLLGKADACGQNLLAHRTAYNAERTPGRPLVSSH